MLTKAKEMNNKIHEGSKAVDAVIVFLMILVCFITLYPMYYVLILSVSDPLEVAAKSVYFWPKGFYLDSYRVLCTDMKMWNSYLYTVIYVVADTALMLLTCVLCAYPLTSKHLLGKKFVVAFLLIPMYFGGGLIPTYLLMVKLNLYNNIWAIIVPGAFSIWNIILVRTFLNSIPETLREAAFIDGASHFKVLFKIYLPLSKPILAVIAIYTSVGVWNSWFNAMVYLPNENIQPLQLYLRRVLIDQTVNLAQLPAAEVEAAVRKQLSNMQLKYAMIIFTTLPIIFTYPFFQKYFVKGVMIGSLKG